jgi:hypothetical protein
MMTPAAWGGGKKPIVRRHSAGHGSVAQVARDGRVLGGITLQAPTRHALISSRFWGHCR